MVHDLFMPMGRRRPPKMFSIFHLWKRERERVCACVCARVRVRARESRWVASCRHADEERKVRGETLLMHAQTTKHFLSVARTHIVLKAANVFPNRVNVF